MRKFLSSFLLILEDFLLIYDLKKIKFIRVSYDHEAYWEIKLTILSMLE